MTSNAASIRYYDLAALGMLPRKLTSRGTPGTIRQNPASKKLEKSGVSPVRRTTKPVRERYARSFRKLTGSHCGPSKGVYQDAFAQCVSDAGRKLDRDKC